MNDPTTPAPVLSRNAPCPCGSGKRFKECHGALRGGEPFAAQPGTSEANDDRSLQHAQRLLDDADVAAAESLCHEVLAANPDHPEALRILALCHYERGKPEVALEALLRAAKSLSSHFASPQQQYAVWTALNLMFTQALTGLDSMFAARLRDDYRTWQASRAECERNDTPSVSIVVVPDAAQHVDAALDSVYRQTYRNLEIIVVHNNRDQKEAQRLAGPLRRCPFPHQLLGLPTDDIVSLINAGVRGSTGAFVNVLHADHGFAETRIAALVRQVANRGFAWGFTGVEFVDSADRPLSIGENQRVDNLRQLLNAVSESDTVGFALFNQEFIPVAESNLFFSRTLYDRVGGFAMLPEVFAWDFSMRSTWLEEPGYVASSEFRRRVAESGGASAPTRTKFEAAQIAMFARYYAIACGDGPAPPNRFAPSLHHWRMHFLKTPLQVGHILAFPVELRERLAEAIIQRSAQQVPKVLSQGVNLVGFAFGEFGLGESLRAFAKTCLSGEIPFVVRDVDLRLSARQADRTLAPHIVDVLKFRCSLFCLNPDMLKPVRNLLAAASSAGGYNVGYWYWELEQLPKEWNDALARVDEVWVATEFVADATRRATAKPVTKIPPPIEVELLQSYQRSDFGLPEKAFLFLFIFDFNSFAKRKNPQGVIAAFRQAFAAGRRDVALVIKSINGANRPAMLREIRALADEDGRIILIDEFLSRDQVSGLQSVVDAFVSLHRSEGFGLGLAESMYLGKPVIGTAYSGNMEFMNPDNSCLVDYELVPIRKGEYLYDDERFRWADPDIGQAAYYMQRLADDAEFRARIAERGKLDIRTRFTQANAAALMRRRLRELGLL
jgi:glycosyltransferase involved in cell wall biosynthesis